MSDWKHRLTKALEPVLHEHDPRVQISAYHNMPCAIFHYPPEEEWPLRQELALLKTRLEQTGKRVTVISLLECLDSALAAEGMSPEALAQAEKDTGTPALIETLHSVLDKYQPLDRIVSDRIPADADPLRDIAFLVRAGALFPFYRTSALLEQLKGKVKIPTVLFYPGILDGASALSFMGVLTAEPNYRPKIF
jgi:hypothetical protein